MTRVPRLGVAQAGLVVVLAAFLLLGWQGITTIARWGPVDAHMHVRYAGHLDDRGVIPSKNENYEYATPPLFHLTALAIERTVDALPLRTLEFSSNLLTRLTWLALVLGGAAAMTATRAWIRLAGLGALALAAAWGALEVLSAAQTLQWSGGQFLSFGALLGMTAMTALLARELWPGKPLRALAAAGVLLAYPVVYRMGVLFHPELPFAFLVSVALFLVVRAERRGWPPALGVATGLACAGAALTRQTAALVIVCVLVTAVVAGRVQGRRYLVACAVTIALVAGPWWVFAYDRWGNPIQSNLEPRESLMLDRQPASFYVSFPLRSLVEHPYRPHFSNELLPKLHAELWSDWFGAFHPFWVDQSRLDRVTASTQSVLGFVGDALALGGLAFVGVPAAVRVARGRRRDERDVGMGLLGLVCAAALAGFVVMLTRFPQDEGDPIKSSYLLFTAPCWALLSVAAWLEVRKRSRTIHLLLVGAAVLYAISYAAHLVGVFT